MTRAAGRAEQEHRRHRPPRPHRRCGAAARGRDRPAGCREPGDAGGGERPDRAGRHRVHPNVLRAEVVREVTHPGLERRLGDAHDVVVREHALAAEVGQRDDAAAAAPRHQRLRAPRHRDERVGADVQRDPEPFARGLREGRVSSRLGRTPRRARRSRGRRTPARSRRTAASICSSLVTSHGSTSGFGSVAASSRTFASRRSSW